MLAAEPVVYFTFVERHLGKEPIVYFTMIQTHQFMQMYDTGFTPVLVGSVYQQPLLHHVIRIGIIQQTNISHTGLSFWPIYLAYETNDYT